MCCQTVSIERRNVLGDVKELLLHTCLSADVFRDVSGDVGLVDYCTDFGVAIYSIFING